MDKPKRILITGISGFVGTYLANYYAGQTAYQIVGLVRTKNSLTYLPTEQASNITYLVGDLLDISSLEVALQDIDIVIHAAAQVSFKRSERTSMYQTNVEGTANLINAALRYKEIYFVHISSIAAIGRHPEFKHVSENTEWTESDHNTHYATSKYLAELEVQRGFAEGMQGSIINPAVILGSFAWSRGTQLFFKSVHNGMPFYPAGETGFVDVRDVVQSIDAVIQARIAHDRFIVSGHNNSYQYVFNQIAQALKKNSPKWPLSYTLIKGALPLSWFLERLSSAWIYTPEVLLNTARRYTYDSGRSIQELEVNYRPLQQTISETAQIWTNHFPDQTPPLLSFHT